MPHKAPKAKQDLTDYKIERIHAKRDLKIAEIDRDETIRKIRSKEFEDTVKSANENLDRARSALSKWVRRD